MAGSYGRFGFNLKNYLFTYFRVRESEREEGQRERERNSSRIPAEYGARRGLNLTMLRS